MISKDKYQEIAKIVETANFFLEENEVSDFSIFGVVWDDDEAQWVVMYYSDYGIHEFINVWITDANCEGKYKLASHSFERIEIDFSYR